MAAQKLGAAAFGGEFCCQADANAAGRMIRACLTAFTAACYTKATPLLRYFLAEKRSTSKATNEWP
ncbi:hypothetical protein [Hymenobacter cavernae]|uniref:Uncharacterized protein n=1 Tax=Hymenobacter cavernae TaxID=2044852 RepID=A0ABQ1UXP7_9BACT|nr:hypothetical protein [Hymenobacter cavernae]GGF28350.1 hypothetical protein GCM10011383_45130 [Hymenobacter cavernae]